MHGVLLRDKKELPESEKLQESLAAKAAMDLLHSVMKSRREMVKFFPNLFSETGELIKLHPELTLAWNVRREQIMLRCKEESESVIIREELALLNSIMISMTKSYCLWNHRKWLVRRFLESESEKKFITSILKLDSRNFHCWSYRQFLATECGVVFDNDQMSRDLLLRDFSSYSAWYLRMTVDHHVPTEELEFVWNAIFTEPNDQSVWQYHDWFMNKYAQTHTELVIQDNGYMNDLISILEEKDKKYLLLAQLGHENANRGKIIETLIKIDPMRSNFYRNFLCR